MNLQKNIKIANFSKNFDLLSLFLMAFALFSFSLNGLYYSYQKSVVIVISIFVIYIKNRRNKEVKISLDKSFYSLLAMLILIVFGLIFFVEKGMAIHSFTTYLLYISSYIMFSNLDESDKNFLKNNFIFFALISLVFIFVFKNNSIITRLSLIIDGEFAGFLQYSNSYALFLLIILHLVLYKKNKYKYAFAFVLIAGIIFTKSNAGIFFMLAYILIYILIKTKKKAIVLFIYLLVLSLAVYLHIINFMGIQNFFASFNPLRSSSFLSRLLYYKDASKMIIARPFGYGYGGYFFSQHFFQTGYDYSVRFVHSMPLQILIDYGLLGFAFFTTLIVSLFKNTKNEDRLIVIFVILYSLIDFHMQFDIFLILLFLFSNNKLKIIVIKNTRFFGILLSSIIAFSIYVFSFNILYCHKDYESSSKIYPYDTLLYKRELKLADDEKLSNMLEINPYLYFAYEELAKRALNDRKYEDALAYARLYKSYYPMRDFKNSFYLSVLAEYLENDYRQELEDELLKYEKYVESLKKERNTKLDVRHKFDFELSDEAKEIIGRFKNNKN